MKRDNALVGVTEHPLQPDQRVIVMVNYSPEAQETEIELDPGWKIAAAYYGEAPAGATGEVRLDIPKNDALVLLAVRL